jgi:hypothetical protein
MEKERKVNGMLLCSILALITLMAALLMSAMPQDPIQPIVPRLGKFNGDIFKNFAEYRVQNSKISPDGILTIKGAPYIMLVNCNSIVKIHRFADRRKNSYACLMFIAEDRYPKGVQPILVRELYEDVLKKMKRAVESR